MGTEFLRRIMNVLVVSGSRNTNGQTAAAVNALVQGAEEAGAKTETFFLPKMNIERCRQCEDSGWGVCHKESRCIIADDFHFLVEKILNSDAVIFATPVYFGDISESMLAFLGRLRRISRPPVNMDIIRGKPAVGICVAGGGGRGTPTCIENLERTITRCGFETVDLIPIKRQNLNMKKEVLKITGRWLANLQEKDMR